MLFMTNQKNNYLTRVGSVFPTVTLDDEIMSESEHVDYLGVRLDGGLRWNDQVEKLAKRLSSNIFVLKNISSLNNISLSKLVYNSLIESLIKYSIILWGLSSQNNLERIFKLQKRAIRTMLKLQPSASCFDHYKELSILTVPCIYMFEKIVYVKEQNLVKAHQHPHNTSKQT